ncbi:MAG TPA: homoserine kinase [Planktothrix sp.]
MTKSETTSMKGIEKRLIVRVPGSTSNLGPGFDTLGLALTIYNTVTFDVLEKNDSEVPLIRLSSATSKSIPVDATNHIYAILQQTLGASAKPLLDRVRISIDCNVPVGSGLGSSGTATLAALWAVQHMRDACCDKESLLQAATKLEGHPDNVSPSLLGGFTISAVARDARRILVEQLRWPEQWRTIFIVPTRSLSTKHARSVLPKALGYSDAVHNIQRVSLLVASVAKADSEMLVHALDDRLHEPYRAYLVPELLQLRKALKSTPALGCVLSGAGPTLMVLAHSRSVQEVLSAIESWSEKQSDKPRILDLQVDQEGLQQLHE